MARVRIRKAGRSDSKKVRVKKRKRIPSIVRFRAKTVADDTGCLVWVGVCDRDGYGQFRDDGKTWQAHVWHWVKVNGEVPKGFEIDHKCRNTSCVKIEHLQSITKAENLRRQRQAAMRKKLSQDASTLEAPLELETGGPRLTTVNIPIDSLSTTSRWFASLTGEYIGRPTKLNREVHEMILRLILEGNYASVAARACGISRTMWSFWRTDWKAKGSKSKYARLMEDVEQAEAMSQADLVAQLKMQTRIASRETNAGATLSMLERRYTERDERWIPRTATELSGPDGGPIESSSDVSDRFREKLEQVESSLTAFAKGISNEPDEEA